MLEIPIVRTLTDELLWKIHGFNASRIIFTITLQTFGHRHGGTIYGFLFTSDILNNLLVGGLSSAVLAWGGWTGFFLVLAGWVVAQVSMDFFLNENLWPDNDGYLSPVSGSWRS